MNVLRWVRAASPTTLQKHWFRRFAEGNFDFDDEPGRAVQVVVSTLKAAVEEDPELTTRCSAERFGYHHSTMARRFHALRRSWNYDVWIPHDLSSHQLNRRVDVCVELLTSHRTLQWLRYTVTVE